MPELPEVETVCRTLRPVLVGKQLTSFELLWPRTLSTDMTTFARGVMAKDIVDVRRRAKLICIVFDDGSLMTVHLRMTGELLWQNAAQSPDGARQAYLRAEFLLNDGSSLLFFDTRKFGRITWIDAGSVHELDHRYGVEPLGSDFTPDWLMSQLKSRQRQMKPLLLDQTFIAGLGNIYVDESLFRARIHPLALANRVPARRVKELHAAIVHVLQNAIEARGTTLRDYRSGLGDLGSNQRNLLVYGSAAGTPCPRCGAGLKRLTVGQRGTVLCPRCQRLPRVRRTPSR